MGSMPSSVAAQDRPELPWASIWERMAKGDPIDVENKTITGVTAMEGGFVRRRVWFKNCVVRGQFKAIRVTFGESLLFEETTFEDGMSLEGCSVHGDFIAIGVKCKSEANFERLAVRGRCSIGKDSEFEPEVNFTLATFDGYADFAGTFGRGANCLQATFKSSLILSIRCSGDFNLQFSSIGGLLFVQPDAVVEGLLDLSRVSASGDVIILMDSFGPAARLSLENARLGASLKLEGGRLLRPAATPINLTAVALAGDLVVGNTKLGRPPKVRDERPLGLNLANATIRGSATFSDFGSTGPVSFFAASISGRLWFKRHEIAEPPNAHGPLGDNSKDNFSRLQVGEFWCEDTVFGSDVEFSDMRCERTTYIMGCEFRQIANFNRAQFGGIFGCQAIFHGAAYFEGTIFRRAVRFVSKDGRRCEFKGVADFYFADFEQEVNFGEATLEKCLDLRYARFSRALLFELKYLEDDRPPSETQFANNTVEIKLRGCRYEAIVLPRDFEKLEDYTKRLPRNDTPGDPRNDDLAPMLYLEQVLRKEGRTSLADRVRCDRFKRQRRRFRSVGFWAWLWNWFYLLSSTYGTTIWQTLIAVVILGAAEASHNRWLKYIPYGNAALVRELGKAAFAAALALAGGLFLDALRRRFKSDLT